MNIDMNIKDKIKAPEIANNSPTVDISYKRILPISQIAAIFLLIYYSINSHLYTIVKHENSTISPKIVNILENTNISGWVMLIMISLILIYSIRHKYVIIRLIGYILSLIIIEISIEMMLSELALEDITNYYIIAIEHPIPLEMKVEYLKSELMRAFTASNLAEMSKENVAYISESIKNKIAYEELIKMNTREISQYARSVINEALNTYTIQNSYTKGIFVTTALGIIGLGLAKVFPLISCL
jgi:hypothetical protein